MKRIIILVVIILSSILVLPFISCGSDDAQESSTFSRLLALFSADTLSDGEIILINYEKIWEDAGISYLKEDGTKMNWEETRDVILTLTMRIGGDSAFDFSSLYSGMNRIAILLQNQFDTLGYHLVADVHAEIIYGRAWDNNLMIGMKGNFTIQATRDAFQAQDEWPEWVIEGFTTQRYLDIPIYSWGEYGDGNHSDAYSPPHLDINGTARPLAAMDGNMLIGGTVNIVKNMISTINGEASSLADIPEYALIAEYMDSFNVYSVIMSKTAIPERLYQILFPIEKYLVVGFGDGKDERGYYAAIVAVYENEDLAQETAGILEETLREAAIRLDEETEFTDIQWEGRVLLAKLYVDEKTLGLNWKYIVYAYLQDY